MALDRELYKEFCGKCGSMLVGIQAYKEICPICGFARSPEIDPGAQHNEIEADEDIGILRQQVIVRDEYQALRRITLNEPLTRKVQDIYAKHSLNPQVVTLENAINLLTGLNS